MRIRLLGVTLIVMFILNGCSIQPTTKSETINSSSDQAIITPNINNKVLGSATPEIKDRNEEVKKENTASNQIINSTPTIGKGSDKDVDNASSTPIIGYSIDEIKQTLLKNNVYDIRLSVTKNTSGRLKYDFNNDGKVETIEYSTVCGNDKNGYPAINKCKLRYDDITVEHEYTSYNEVAGGISSIGIMDINKNDNFIEFFISEGELADRVTYAIFRLTDKGIEEICSLQGEIQALSGDGKIYYWGGNLYESNNDSAFDTNLVISYFDINKKDYVQTNQIEGKTIIADRQIRVFKEENDVISGAPLTEDDITRRSRGKIVKTIKSGEEFKVLNVVDRDHVKIITKDRKIGWIGGFHMVWD